MSGVAARYLDANVVGPRSADDASHIAIATIYKVEPPLEIIEL
jgi:hypothetical protein